MHSAFPAARRRYYTLAIPALVVHTLLLMVMIPMVREAEAVSTRVLLALLPLIPMAIAMLESARYVSRLDELHRRAHLQAVAVGALATCFLTFAWTMLEIAGLPKLPTAAVFPLFCGIYGVAVLIMLRRFR